ncbi:MAG: amino acid ABC transporter substrate-binding protein [Burkholderiales bacterium]|nr:amino acid ABC transporter substrate-binding protein [Burkholderiales bacterium]MDE2456625.1 amino acid ABC transporter substrate-binding protein [Burkholderiales bacterium]
MMQPIRRLLLCAALACASLYAVPAAAQAKLKVAADVGYSPFFVRNADGKLEGFSFELANEVARRMGYSGAEVVDTPFSAIFAGLFSKRFDMIVAPTNITAERAAQMLFTEPYMPTGIGFLARKGAKLDNLAELKGKVIAVNNGSFSDKWLQENQAKYGYEVQRFNKNSDAVQAVMIGRAFANLAETPVVRFIARDNAATAVVFTVTTGTNFGFALRKDEVEMRNKADMALECMKHDGSLSKLHQKWFGVPADPDSSMTKIYPGYGTPGFEGYDPTEHALNCGKP